MTARHCSPLLLGFVLACLLAACATQPADSRHERGAVLSVQPVNRFERAAIDKENPARALSGEAQCDVTVVQLTYQSIGVHGEPAVLSAALYVPENCAGPYPVLAEAHGTQSDRERLTTEVGAGAYSISFFAARGYLVVATDYLGLGKSDYPYHPYLHASSEASAVVDSIRAARNAARTLTVPVSDEVMLFGYSQGGHAAMAAQREIERAHAKEFRLVASAPMAGPYFLSQTFVDAWFGHTAGETNLLASELLAYTLVSYDRVYPEIYSDPLQVFAEKYAKPAEQLFPSTQSLFAIRQQNVFPPGARIDELRNPVFSGTFLTDEQQPFRAALRRNDVLDWTPQTPMLLCGSHRDAVVSFDNTLAAQASFRARGVSVPVVDVADTVPASANGVEHHVQYGAPLCYARARAELFDPVRTTHENKVAH